MMCGFFLVFLQLTRYKSCSEVPVNVPSFKKKSEPSEHPPVRGEDVKTLLTPWNLSVKKNLNAAPQLSEHPPVRGKECPNV